ncbi:putative Deoxyuridine 5'-triphosphate nucleotidohydrolase [Thamnocephalis sphaerospora]|uniref:Deoxyuridine 5'-triphosphate nucleotidohydrolase n=1 Tax=Thamnocephalis sphaerospora TaxID=78915 RepID=A0A4P9XIN3_9FUNG|nr:putative Deoxyuridine 5'-triphosphate nucleotidohydrolase [Thamnocephalis sphaerospora]RKP05572.1 putative Deoxyuridine 5'-triphosphate nucleotidohydrolase [Thamnocephalis sphaerospora]|eukprot:RKP05571.1 putative Deoxyuridine 5'-triphosphate nucleotidohydrolase [Thamnocephalis sphaerospora]
MKQNDTDPGLRIRLLTDQARLPQRATANAAGYDLYAARDVQIPTMEQRLIPTDIAIEMPPGVYGRIAPRSGLAARHALMVQAGVIDADYRGNIQVLLFNLGRQNVTLRAGERIAQLILECCKTPTVVVASQLSISDRNTNGWGSTGTATLQNKTHAAGEHPARQSA